MSKSINFFFVFLFLLNLTEPKLLNSVVDTFVFPENVQCVCGLWELYVCVCLSLNPGRI